MKSTIFVFVLAYLLVPDTYSQTDSTTIPDDFVKTFSEFHSALKQNDFTKVLTFLIFPQNDGYFSLFHNNKRKYLEDFQKYWKNYTWKDPIFQEETRNYFNNKSKKWVDVEGITVEFFKEDLAFFFVKTNNKYKVKSVYVNLEGGD